MRITKRIYSGVGYYEVNFGADKVKKILWKYRVSCICPRFIQRSGRSWRWHRKYFSHLRTRVRRKQIEQ
jgi:hypothetical protein